MSAAARPPQPPTCRKCGYNDAHLWTVCPRCKTPIWNPERMVGIAALVIAPIFLHLWYGVPA